MKRGNKRKEERVGFARWRHKIKEMGLQREIKRKEERAGVHAVAHKGRGRVEAREKEKNGKGGV